MGTVAAGDDAEQMAVGYQLGYAPREVTIDFQVRACVLTPWLLLPLMKHTVRHTLHSSPNSCQTL